MSVEKLVKDGMVAVMYSPGYGAGWSTWAGSADIECCLFDNEIAQAVLDGDKKEAERIAEKKMPNQYMGGLRDLRVYWMKQGTQFEIDEYDGNESVREIGEIQFHIA